MDISPPAPTSPSLSPQEHRPLISNSSLNNNNISDNEQHSVTINDSNSIQHNGLISWAKRRIVNPLIVILKSGATSEGISLSLACGIMGGLFPIPATTTIACIALTWLLKLNFAAVQITNLLMTPANIATFLWFIKIGETIFNAQPNNISLQAIQSDPLASIAKFGWSLTYGVIAWLFISPFGIFIFYNALKPIINKAMQTVKFS